MVGIRILKTAALRVRAYGELVMFSHSIFSFSFLALSACVAWSLPRIQGKPIRGFPDPRTSVLLVLAFLGARTCANALNRIIDRGLDAANERTQDRHLPSGRIRTAEAVFIAFFSFLLLCAAAWLLDPVCVALLPVAGILVLVYSFTKRFTWFCHGVLGVACAAAPAGAWIALRGRLEWPALFLCAANALWVTGFDIVYAVQDIDFDSRAGLHSIPARFGKNIALGLAALAHLGTVFSLCGFGLLAGLGFFYWAGILLVAVLLFKAMIAAWWDYRTKVQFASYSANQLVSLTLLAATVLEFSL